MFESIEWKLALLGDFARPEIAALMLSAVWGFLHLVLVGQLSRRANGWAYTASARDVVMPPLEGVPGRLERAFRNYMETYPFFVAAVAAALLTGRTGDLTAWGAFAYLAGRIAYVPLYASGIPLIRSLAWNVAAFGMLAVLLGATGWVGAPS